MTGMVLIATILTATVLLAMVLLAMLLTGMVLTAIFFDNNGDHAAEAYNLALCG